MEKNSNQLIHASSPYLLQHAHNPVDWHEWNSATLAKAKVENKLIIVSIGYSACHWCHVMERESFESDAVAEVMNKHFICVKVDREERPDIDQIYMLAVQIMNGNGGWPLNAICLPDQRPIYGGTYFRKDEWISILTHVAQLWQSEPEKALDYANKLTDAIEKAEKIEPIKDRDLVFGKAHLEEVVKPWINHFDVTDGGYNRAPKFPLPNNWIFMLRYGFLANHQALLQHTGQTLEKMARGGIYDQIGGGFARYSVDGLWHVPHFEKMLYDNAQLISLYAEAYQQFNHPPFKDIAEETIAWAFREMQSPEGLFYSALDADSEGIEGKFYVWDKQEFERIVGQDASLLCQYYNVTDAGNWEEEETNVLRITISPADLAQENGLTLEQLKDKIDVAKNKLLTVREKRVRPGLDDKCLVAWNGLMISALADASRILANTDYYVQAKRAMDFILDNMVLPDGGLYRNFKSGKASISGFLDDYAFVIDALLALYNADFDEDWLLEAQSLCNYVLANFTDSDNEMLFYTSAKDEELIARKHEVMDNVIPAANSVMAQNLQKLAIYFDDDAYSQKASGMLKAVQPRIKAYGSGYSNWCIQLAYEIFGVNEIAIVGDIAGKVKAEFDQQYIPNKLFLGGKQSTLPLLADKPKDNGINIYVCRNKTCQLPVKTVAEAMKLMAF